MAESKEQKRARLLKSERKHEKPPPPVATATSAFALDALPREPVDAPFQVLTAHPSKWDSPRGMAPASVVIHCTAAENPARSTALFFHDDNDSGSTQAVADDNEGFTCVPDDAICAGAPPLNQEGLHIEQPGLVEWSRATWLSHDAQLRRVAHWTAEKCKRYNIPARFLTADNLRAMGEQARGITTHAQVSAAFHQSTHTDPGPNFPMDVFMSYVELYVRGGDEMTPEETAKLNKALEQANEALKLAKESDERWAGFNDRRAGKPEPTTEGPRKNGWRSADEAFSRPKPTGGGGGPMRPFDATITPKP